MQILEVVSASEVVTFDATGPITVGVVTFIILLVGLGFVRQVGNFRPHSMTTDE